MAEAKKRTALLNGLTRRTFFGETVYDDATLKTQIFPELSDDAFLQLLSLHERALVEAAREDMDQQQLDEHLKALKMSEADAQNFSKFWRNQKTKVHEQLVKDANFNNRLKALSWRIDVKTKSKHIKELNEPTAVVELQLSGKESDVVRFEMDAAQVKEVVEQLSRVEAAIMSA